MQIAKYFASLGFRVDRREIQKVDNHLKLIERKLQAFSKKITKVGGLSFQLNNFDVNQKKLNMKIGNALDLSSKKLFFQVNNFDVNQGRLNLVVGNALDLASTRLVMQLNNFDVNQALLNRKMIAATRIASRAASNASNINPDVNARSVNLPLNARQAAGIGGVGGLAARAYMPAVGLALGGYGLGWSNRRNQEVVAARMQTEAVQQAYGATKEQGTETFEWLQSEADRVGFSFMDASPDFNNLMSNLLGAGGSVEDAKTVFKGFAEYGRVNKLSNARQQLVFNALGQVAGKDKLQAEELTKQLGNSLPGAKSIFAEAYQRQTGGRLKGGEAIQALEAAMGDGKVRGDILKFAAQVASEMAAPGLSAAQRASQAEQNRAKNERDKLVGFASEAGLEEGWSRIWRALTTSMKESVPVVEAIARGFNEMSKYVSFAIMLPQSFKRAFEGRDSYIADAIGEMNAKILYDLTTGLGELTSEIATTLSAAIGGWGAILKEIGPAIGDFLRVMKDIFLYTFKMLNAFLPGGGGVDAAANYGRAMTASLNGASPEDVKLISEGKDQLPAAPAPRLDFSTRPITSSGNFIYDVATKGSSQIGAAAASPFEWMAMKFDEIKAQNQIKNELKNAVNIGTVAISIDGVFQSREEADIAGKAIAAQFMKEVLSNEIEKTMPQFSQKE